MRAEIGCVGARAKGGNLSAVPVAPVVPPALNHTRAVKPAGAPTGVIVWIQVPSMAAV